MKNKIIVALMILACVISIAIGKWRMANEKASQPVAEPVQVEETKGP